jgi:transposase
MLVGRKDTLRNGMLRLYEVAWNLFKEKARMIKNHLPNILTYFKHRNSNAITEGLNSKIQTIKANARGYRSFEGFRNSILFLLWWPTS